MMREFSRLARHGTGNADGGVSSGASPTKHRHNANTFAYVLESSIIIQVECGKAVTLGPGQTFYESTNDVYTVSKNASETQPAKFLVFFVKDKGAPASIPLQ